MTQEEARRVMDDKYPDRVCVVTRQLWQHGDGHTSEALTITLFAKDYVRGMDDPCEQYDGEHYEDIIAEIDKAEGVES